MPNLKEYMNYQKELDKKRKVVEQIKFDLEMTFGTTYQKELLSDLLKATGAYYDYMFDEKFSLME